MAKDGKATIPNRHTRRPSHLLGNQQCQKLPRSSWRNLAISILCASSGATWFSIGNGAAIATPEPEPKTRLPALNAGEPQIEAQLPRSNGDPELGILRVREREVQTPQSESDLELGTLRVRELEVQPPQSDSDLELGTLRVQEREVQPPQSDSDLELGTLRVQEQEVQPPQSDSDLELGTLRVRQLEVLPSYPEAQSPRIRPTARLLGHVGYFQTNNIFSGVDPVNDGLILSGLTLWATYSPRPKTNFITAIDGSLVRYLEQSEFNYNQFRFRAGIRQQLTSRMYGEIGWIDQQLFRAGVGDRFLKENFIRLALYRRDQLTNKLRLDSLYEFRLGDANPDSRSRIINSLSVSLSYYIQRNLQVGLDYQFALSLFTQRDREDQNQRLLGRLTYAVSSDSQVSVQGGLTLGGSSDPDIDFDNFFFSVNYTVELGKF